MKRKGLSRRLLSVLLALVMLLSLLPTAVFAATPKAKLVTDASELKAGDQIILTATANSKTYVAGSLSGKYLTSIETDPADPAANVEVFTLGGKAGAWTLTASDGKQIYTAAAKALNNAGKGTGTWTISIDANGLATVASTDTNYGRILYNVNSPRFMNYTSATNATMLLPSIYRLEVSSARQSGVIALENIQDGDKVVIFNPANGKALSTDYAGGFYNQATDVTLTDGKLTGYTDADLWTITKNTDGTYTIATADGKKLSMDTGYTSTPLDKANNAWKVTAVAGKDATYYIDNATRTDKYRLQWFAKSNNWSAYTGTGDAFEQQLYLVIDSGSETPDPEPEPTSVPISEALAGAKDEKFTVKGVVTFTDGSNVFLQDATGGICLYLSAADDNIKLGDTIVGTGTRGDYKGQPQLSKGTYVKSSGLTLAAKPTTIGAITNADICTYVKLTDLEITEIYDKNGSFAAPNVTVKDAEGKTIQIFKAAMKKVDGK